MPVLWIVLAGESTAWLGPSERAARVRLLELWVSLGELEEHTLPETKVS